MKMDLKGEKVERRDMTALGESEARGPCEGLAEHGESSHLGPKGCAPPPGSASPDFRGVGEDQDRLRCPVGCWEYRPLCLCTCIEPKEESEVIRNSESLEQEVIPRSPLLRHYPQPH